MKKTICPARLLCLLLALLMTFGAAVAEEEHPTYDIIYSSSNPVPEIAARIRPSVVQINIKEETWDPITRVASVKNAGNGSGTYIRSEDGIGYILTNNHVVEDGGPFSLLWLDGTEMDAKLVGTDDATDTAILSFTEPAPEGAELIPLGDSDALQIGELIVVIGNPGLPSEILFDSVFAGIVSGLGRPAVAPNFSRGISVIQVDAALNVGVSGGALLNAKGELVGIPTMKYMYGIDVIYEGLGFCVPINTVKDGINQIIETGKVVRPRMGMSVINFDGPEDPMVTILPAGLQVNAVEPGGPAAKAGLQANDIITKVNGVRVHNFIEMTAELDRFSAGESVELTVCRYYDKDGNLTGDHEELTFTLELVILD